jgi:hypothetical protein
MNEESMSRMRVVVLGVTAGLVILSVILLCMDVTSQQARNCAMQAFAGCDNTVGNAAALVILTMLCVIASSITGLIHMMGQGQWAWVALTVLSLLVSLILIILQFGVEWVAPVLCVIAVYVTWRHFHPAKKVEIPTFSRPISKR